MIYLLIMSQAISLLSIVPIRKSPSDISEMVSQLLFGETCRIVKEDKNWLGIVTNYDDYSGWIDKKMVTLTEDGNFNMDSKMIVKQPLLYIINDKTNSGQWITAGSELYNVSEDYTSFSIGPYSYKIKEFSNITKVSVKNIIKDALNYINAPYMWGGKTIFGIDCSGFTQMVFKINNDKLPRDSRDQYDVLSNEIQLQDAQPGDIAFFSKNGQSISHVGLIMSPDKIIHASGCVRIDALDAKGIYNSELQRYTHNLLAVKKMT
ncbi:MAG: C40 family peptidase [Bacteroidales bacterium]|nr:C40 family peptidase [Bacteroidales bacterium]